MAEFSIEKPVTRENAALNFLKLFYPFHYNVGTAVEKHLSCGVLDRHQTVILWLIYSKGDGGVSMRRKVIEQLIGEWYELSSPAISKALRRMAQAPLNLLEIDESAESGREKTIRLTKKGQAFVLQMVDNGAAFIEQIVHHLSSKQISTGIEFLARVSEIVETELNISQ